MDDRNRESFGKKMYDRNRESFVHHAFMPE
jgi:hypothetical protein